MTEQLLLKLVEQKALALGAVKYSITNRNYTISAEASKRISSFHQVHFVAECPLGLTLESYSGEYDINNPLKDEQVVDHQGVIEITNHTDEDLTIEFIVLILHEFEGKPDLGVVKLTEKQKEEAERLGLTPSDYIRWKLKYLVLPEVCEPIKINNPVGVFRLPPEMRQKCRAMNQTPSGFLELILNQ